MIDPYEAGCLLGEAEALCAAADQGDCSGWQRLGEISDLLAQDPRLAGPAEELLGLAFLMMFGGICERVKGQMWGAHAKGQRP